MKKLSFILSLFLISIIAFPQWKWQYDSSRFDFREYLEYNIDSSMKISKRGYLHTTTSSYKYSSEIYIHKTCYFKK